ncbi:DUF6804 family protein [Cryobacterium roopkundense]|uniref:Uncharacterized protein n=1 Tax=Cryobacterium roopkundense TaxID=1001240 RepID=A0A7W8ZWT6_9MICO|nr:DUF6804 family protein [Cryobacterium roopkundense]MBB5641673.1 hypothetical protein [Cryobacterium roopkundense]
MRAHNRPMGTAAATTFTRSDLAPGMLAALTLLAGLALLASDGFTIIRSFVSILALILCVFVIQAKTWWWLIALAPIAVLWNPVAVIPWEGQGWAVVRWYFNRKHFTH